MRQITWFGVLPFESDSGQPSVYADTQIKFVNADGTFTDIHGSGFGTNPNGSNTGTVTQILHLGTDGTTVLDNLSGLNVSVAYVAAALGDREAGSEFLTCAGAGNNTLTALHAQVGNTNYYFTSLDSSPGNDTIVGQVLSADLTSEWWSTGMRRPRCRSIWRQAWSPAGLATTR